MSAKYGLLGLLRYGDQTGYELNTIFTHSLNNFWHTQTSQIYKELTTMEKDGWLSSSMVYQEDKPNKKVYTITKAGDEAFMAWLDKDFIEKEMRIRNAFLVKVFFLGEQNLEENIIMFKQYLEKNKAVLVSLENVEEHIADGASDEKEQKRSLYWKMTASYGKHFYQMCVEWASEMIEILEQEKAK